ncbi:hypothetical protein HOL34_04085 [bacterium]|nr:hypothetical protein [bacterium]MBT3903254.1 hypothetical protein [bacterium]MBT4578264.1 hypothetical protein [bacterium]MBT5345578.1 hypothetical protein [bacterium]MBT6131063.1 hypothetical protein [bacterium]
MKQPKQRHSLAWFKLAEFVARGEKERALGIYRLLSHSLEEKGLAFQLEADLLRSFDDQVAFERYEQAAYSFAKNGSLEKAVFLYEFLLSEQGLNKQHLIALTLMYDELELRLKHLWTVSRLCVYHFNREKEWEFVERCLELHATNLSQQDRFDVLGQVALWYAQNESEDFTVQCTVLDRVLDLWISNPTEARVKGLMHSLQVVSPRLYQHGMNRLKLPHEEDLSERVASE